MADSPNSTEHPLPAQFGRYRILDRLARGGMANLYLARFAGPDGFEKLVAIKQIHEHLTTQGDFLSMFKDEARLAARIAHPNVAQVLELGEVDNVYFITMEYVEGESLTELIKATEIPRHIVARIIADGLAGLHAAHELRSNQGDLLHVVHRDLSPSNILISYEGAVKVVDFGVAKARDNLNITNAGTIKGKFAYMAPEQVNDEPVDRRADIFAAGILLFEATTRRNLFKADTPAASVARITKGQVPLPSKVIPGYPEDLEEIVMKALQVNPAERYQTAKEMQEELEEFIFSSGAPVTAAKVGELMRKVFADRLRMKKQLLREKTLPGVGRRTSAAKTVTEELSPRPPDAPPGAEPSAEVVITPGDKEKDEDRTKDRLRPPPAGDEQDKKQDKKQGTGKKPILARLALLKTPFTRKAKPPLEAKTEPAETKTEPAEAKAEPAEPAEAKDGAEPEAKDETEPAEAKLPLPLSPPLPLPPPLPAPPPIPGSAAPEMKPPATEEPAPLPDIPSAGAKLSKATDTGPEQAVMEIEEIDLVDILSGQERKRKLLLAGGGGLAVVTLLIITLIALNPDDEGGGKGHGNTTTAATPDATQTPVTPPVDAAVPDTRVPTTPRRRDLRVPDLLRPDTEQPDMKRPDMKPDMKRKAIRPHGKKPRPKTKTKKGLFGNPY